MHVGHALSLIVMGPQMPQHVVKRACNAPGFTAMRFSVCACLLS